MRITVRNKIIAGFALFAMLLVITNILSYLGLSDIRQSAESVAEQKMPMQQQMLEVQNHLLILGKVSTEGYYTLKEQELLESHQQFQQLSSELNQGLKRLESMYVAQGQKSDIQQGSNAIDAYVQAAQEMYQTRTELLAQIETINSHFETIQITADEAGALLLDLSYMDGAETDPALKRLVGASATVDNSIIPLLNATKELVATSDAQLSATIIDNLRFTLGDIDNQVNFMNRLAQGVDTDGILDTFQSEYDKLQPMYSASDGLFNLQLQKLALLSDIQQFMQQAETSLEVAINEVALNFGKVNESTLKGQNTILDIVKFNVMEGLIIMSIALVLVVVIGVTLGNIISAPLSAIGKSLSQISSGDLTHRVEVKGNDEFSAVAESVNQLAEALHQVVKQIVEQASILEQAAHSSVSLGDDTLSNVAQQQQQIQQTAQNTQSIQHTSQNNVQQIHLGMDKLDQVKQQTNKMGKLVQQSSSQVEEQSRQAQFSSEIIHRLEENSKNIGGILDVIKNIAEQTNLLALNAAIEAARAGEQGRGFAVVADEVRTLANRTHDSTEEIERMIASLQTDAKQAVSAINSGQEQANVSVELIQKVNEDVSLVLEIVEVLANMNQQIVSDSDQQDRLLVDVADSLATIVCLAEKSAGTTQQSNDAANQVNTMVEDMRKTVSQFKV